MASIIILGAMSSLIAAAVYGWLPHLAKRIAVYLAERLPTHLVDRFVAEWSAEIDGIPEAFGKLIYAISLFSGVVKIRRHDSPLLRGASRLTSIRESEELGYYLKLGLAYLAFMSAAAALFMSFLKLSRFVTAFEHPRTVAVLATTLVVMTILPVQNGLANAIARISGGDVAPTRRDITQKDFNSFFVRCLLPGVACTSGGAKLYGATFEWVVISSLLAMMTVVLVRVALQSFQPVAGRACQSSVQRT